MLLRNLKAVNFLALREADVRNLPRRGVVGVEGGNAGAAAVFSDMLRFALFGVPAPGGDVIRSGASFAYVEIEFVHPEAGPVSLFRGTDRRGMVQASLREPERRFITNSAEQVGRRMSELLPFGAEEFGRVYLGEELSGPAPADGPADLAEPEPDKVDVGREHREILDQILDRGSDPRRSFILAIALSGLAVLLFALLFAARKAFGLTSPFVSAAQAVAGLVLLLDVWLAIRAFRLHEASKTAAPIEGVEPPAQPAAAPPLAPPPPPGMPDLTPELVREVGARGTGDAARFLVLAGRWPGDADELLRAAGPSVSQVFLLAEVGGTPPGADLKLAVRGDGRLIVAG
jgi:hypothetical protein